MNQLIFIPESMLPQGSDVWLKRRSIVGTATQAACVAGQPLSYQDSPKWWRDLRAERAFGSTFKGNPDSMRGQRLEPVARALFNEVYKGQIEPMEPIWCERELAVSLYGDYPSVVMWEWSSLPEIKSETIASSYDGYSRNGDFHAWLEIKCPRGQSSKTWKAVDQGRIPDDYYWQVVHQRATFGDHEAFGYFMVYLEDGDYLIMAIDDDERVKSGQFAEDVLFLEEQWSMFLSGEGQPGDMSTAPDWKKLEEELAAGRKKRLELEAVIKPHSDAEERAKKALKQLIVEQYGESSGLRKAFGTNVSFSNRAKPSFDLEAFKDANPDFDLSQYEVVNVTVDTDRLRADHPEMVEPFESVKDSWYVSVKA